MKKIPVRIQADFKAVLDEKHVAANDQGHYFKWLRYYLDFCEKYDFDPYDSRSLPCFLGKLKDKHQSRAQQQQAKEAIDLFLNLYSSGYRGTDGNPPQNSCAEQEVAEKAGSHPATPSPAKDAPHDGNPAETENTVQSETEEQWKAAMQALIDSIKVRHYSPRTLESYVSWVSKFQKHSGMKNPHALTTTDVKAYLTFLAVERKLSASSQNQAFNALLFFFRHVLGREFGKIEGVVRAKRKPYIPVVLTREEIDRILQQLQHPYDLVVQLLYGCGLRLFECLNLRVNSFNFDFGILTVHDGKGKKDRTVPLPEVLVPKLSQQLERVKTLHENDLKAGYDGAFMFDSIERKYKNSARELVWQWFFPATYLTRIPATGQRKRYHLHESHVQKALRQAVQRAKIIKRVSSHTFRHSFASHLLQANYDIRTIQELLGHSDVRTTMIYTHTVKSQTLKEARSPLDF